MYYERRRSRRRPSYANSRGSVGTLLRRPSVQIFILLVVAIIVYLIAIGGGGSSLPRDVSVDQAYQMYQQGAFVLDVRTQEEWNEYHAPNTTLIPLDQLPARLGEIPRDQEIVVVCRSGNRSQQGRDILLSAGFTQVTSMTGGLNEWGAKGFPIEGARP